MENIKHKHLLLVNISIFVQSFTIKEYINNLLSIKFN